MTAPIPASLLKDVVCQAALHRSSLAALGGADTLTVTFEGALLNSSLRRGLLLHTAHDVSRRYSPFSIDAWHFAARRVNHAPDVYLAMAFPLGTCIRATSTGGLVRVVRDTF